MELKTLNTFLRAAQIGKFSKTAQELGYSQSAVTMQIQQLENELGVKLFDRVGKTVALTPAGMRLEEYARTIIQTIEQAENDVKSEGVRGKLRIGIAASLCSTYLPQILKKYHELYPMVEIILRSDTQENMFSMLTKNEIDMLYTLDEQIFKNEYTKMMEKAEDVFFVSSARNKLADQKRLNLKDITGCDFILTEKGMSYRDGLDRLLASKNLAVTPFLEVGDTAVICSLVEQNMGISFLPEYTVRDSIKNGYIKKLDVQQCTITVYRQLLCRKDKYITPQMKAMFDILIENEKKGRH